MDTRKRLSRIDEFESIIKAFASGEELEEPYNALHEYSILYGYHNIERYYPAILKFTLSLKHESGMPIVIHECDAVPVKKDDGYKGTDHVSEIKAEILGTVAHGGYHLDGGNFYILLNEYAKHDMNGGIEIKNGEYKLDSNLMRGLNYENWYHFFETNHIAKRFGILLGPEIKSRYRKEGLIMTPDEFAEQISLGPL